MEIPSDAPYSGEPWPQVEKNHAAMITRLDDDVGRVLRKLKDLGLEDEYDHRLFERQRARTRKAVPTPRSSAAPGPLRGYKRALYEGGIRVPMIVRWPGRVPAGAVSDAVWAFWDVLPTLAGPGRRRAPRRHRRDLAGLDPARQGRRAPATSSSTGSSTRTALKQAVRTGDWKAVRARTREPLELYNLKDDIGETHDIASDHADVVARIEAYLKTARTDSPDFPITAKSR